MPAAFQSLFLTVDRPSRMVVRHPVTLIPLTDAEGSEAWIDLRSADSQEAMQISRKNLQRRIDGNHAADPDGDYLEFLAAMVADWRLVGLDGNPVELTNTPERAKALLSAPGSFWLREQIQRFVHDRGNFLPVSEKG